MSTIELQLPDDLVERIRNHAERLPEILELGLREISSEASRDSQALPKYWSFWPTFPLPRRF